MADAPYTLALLFGFDTKHAPDTRRIVDAVKRAVRDVSVLKHVAARGIPDVQWSAVVDQSVKLVRQTLDISLSSVLARAWNGYAPLREYADTRKYPPDQVITVALAKHKVTSSHRPFVEVRVDGQAVGKVDVAVDVAIAFDQAALVIQNGRFMALRSGSVAAEGSIKWRDAELVKRALGKLDLPGEISFGDGIPIDPLGAALRSPTPPSAAVR
jgi:hypothetical protein